MTTITPTVRMPEPVQPASDQLYHTVCSHDGRWQNFGLIDGDVDDVHPGFVGASATEVGGALTLVGVGTDGELYHTARNADGSWRPFADLRSGPVDGGPRDFYAAACSSTRGALQLVGVGSDGQLYHTIRRPHGGWQDHFEPVQAALHRGPRTFTAVACAGVRDSLHVIALDDAGQAHHVVREPNGWQSFSALGRLYDAPTRFVAIDCAAVGGSLHIVGVGSDARLHHTIRWPDGSWQRYFGVLGGQQHGIVPRFTLSIACARVGHALGLVAICSDHRLFHSIRMPDGSWRGSLRFGKGQLSSGSPEIYDVSAASTGNALHVIGGTWQGGFA